jgi:acyl dehydratase
MIDRGRIGWRSEPSAVRIDGWRVKLFCQAIAETDPVYWDEAAARAAGHPGCPVPPTFLKAIEGEHFSSAALLKLLGAPLAGVLHAEQSFEWLKPVHAGDTITVTRQIADIYDKKDGALTFIVVDTHYLIGSSSAAQSRQTILVRNKVAVA